MTEARWAKSQSKSEIPNRTIAWGRNCCRWHQCPVVVAK